MDASSPPPTTLAADCPAASATRLITTASTNLEFEGFTGACADLAGGIVAAPDVLLTEAALRRVAAGLDRVDTGAGLDEGGSIAPLMMGAVALETDADLSLFVRAIAQICVLKMGQYGRISKREVAMRRIGLFR